MKYLIKWENYPPESNSWEPYHSLKNASDKVEEYERTKRARESCKLLKKKRTKSESPDSKMENQIKEGQTPQPKGQANGAIECHNSANDESRGVVPNSLKKEADKKLQKDKLDDLLTKVLNSAEKKKDEFRRPMNVIKLDILLNGKLNVLVKWENDEIDYVDYDTFRLKYPQLLLEFYENRSEFISKDGTTRKFLCPAASSKEK